MLRVKNLEYKIKLGEPMKLIRNKRKNIIIIIATCLILSTVIFGVVFGYYRQLEASKYNTTVEKPSSTEANKTPENNEPKTDSIINAVNNSKTKDEPITSSVTPSTQSNTQQNSQPTYVAPATISLPPQQPEPQEQVATCNEAMKSSYTNLYNSQVVQENASWANQISSWQSDARARGTGIASGGYVQGMINDNLPAHDARLAQLQAQYYLNLASINCI